MAGAIQWLELGSFDDDIELDTKFVVKLEKDIGITELEHIVRPYAEAEAVIRRKVIRHEDVLFIMHLTSDLDFDTKAALAEELADRLGSVPF